ncbi:hypothetical protein C6P40_000125 [Pichia californica]|uniref:Uncharacterized protein n=1 Tax=Pichia californica TaxID=460514 RepID=A0A9P6WN86_9ASCO|nr:hypothetical protein C6P42_005245 [[Candida] californica]KAG0689098.1 hypothetical protein C6P40_000125 [[Candida] californica]
MGKGAIKFGGKSGLLPKPKEIFKQPYKHQVYKKPADSGYAEGILHPKKITRDYIIPKVFTPEQLLKKSAHEPTKKYTQDEISKMPVSQQFKIKNSEMRRKYLKESYETEIKRLEKVEKFEEKLKIEEEKVSAESAQHKQSKAEFYTSPTIESYLKGPLVRPRTEEEKETLRIKKESNRLQTILDVDVQKASNLFELYNASANYAITEEKLEKMVDSAFDNKADLSWQNIASSTPNKINAIKNNVTFDAALVDVVLDNVNKGPGYEAVEDYLNGFTDDIKELSEQIKREKNLLDIETANENLNKVAGMNRNQD